MENKFDASFAIGLISKLINKKAVSCEPFIANESNYSGIDVDNDSIFYTGLVTVNNNTHPVSLRDYTGVDFNIPLNGQTYQLFRSMPTTGDFSSFVGYKLTFPI